MSTPAKLASPAELARWLVQGQRARRATWFASALREAASMTLEQANARQRPSKRLLRVAAQAEQLAELAGGQALQSLRRLHPPQPPRRRRKREGQLELLNHQEGKP